MFPNLFRAPKVGARQNASTELEHVTQSMYVKNKELNEKNKILSILRQIDDTVLTSSANTVVVGQGIVDIIAAKTDFPFVALFTADHQSGNIVLLAVSHSEEIRRIDPQITTDLKIPLTHEKNILVQAIKGKGEKETSKLSDAISTADARGLPLTIQKKLGITSLLAIPLIVGGRTVGIMLVGLTQRRQFLAPEEEDLISRLVAVVGVALDNILLTRALKEANEYLADLDKLKDEFISMASHELNTPLAAIEGYLSMVLDEGLGKVDPKAKEYLTRAYDSSKRLAELIMDLLNVSRIEQGRLKMKFSKANFAQLAESVIKELQLKADTKKLYLKLDAPQAGLPESYCDAERIREVFVNLIGNSIKFTDKGGITTKLSHSDDHIRVEIIDTGRGIAKEDQKKLFQKFSQVKREVDEHQGTGLGLYISKNFIDLHKGQIGVESEAGKGATFFFEIPIMKSAPKEVPGAMLDSPVNTPQIETDTKGLPAIVLESEKGKG